MRFVPTSCLKDGMINGKTLYGRNGEIMLHEKSVIKQSYISKIANLGYSGIYILDDISKDIEIVDIINDTLKIETVQKIKDIFVQVNREKSNDKNIYQIMKLAENIVDEILESKNTIFNLIDLRIYDEYTFYHSVNVAVLATIIGIGLNLDKKMLIELGISGLLHDIGKVFVNKGILTKNGKLTNSEFMSIKEHPTLGYKYLKKNYMLPIRSYRGILQHHEKYDGTGYPHGVRGKNISLFGRILIIADIYDALISDRPYRKGVLPSEAMEYIMGGGGTFFDIDIVRVFAKKIALYPAGTCVKLSNGTLGIVAENFENHNLRPNIKVISDGGKNIEPYIIELRKELRLTIASVVNIWIFLKKEDRW